MVKNAPTLSHFWLRAGRFLRLLNAYAGRRTRAGHPPFTLIVEPTNFCNLNCRMCFQSGMRRPRGFLELNTARAIAEQARELDVRHVQFAFGGEPTLHPELPELIDIFQQQGLRVELFTNAVKLDAALAERLLDAQLAMINFSVDGFDAATYGAIRPPADFDQVLENIQRFDALMRRRGTRLPFRRLYVTPQPANLEQLQAGLPERVFGPYVDGYYFNAPNNWTGAVPDQVIGAPPPAVDGRRCMYVWVMMVVAHDGRVLPCPCDYDARCQLGDIHTSTLRELWNGPRLQTLRRMGRLPAAELPEICQACLWRQASNPLRLLFKRATSELRVYRAGGRRGGR